MLYYFALLRWGTCEQIDTVNGEWDNLKGGHHLKKTCLPLSKAIVYFVCPNTSLPPHYALLFGHERKLEPED